jgi:hypothetical protein
MDDIKDGETVCVHSQRPFECPECRSERGSICREPIPNYVGQLCGLKKGHEGQHCFAMMPMPIRRDRN